jgi:hypothetical protein
MGTFQEAFFLVLGSPKMLALGIVMCI